jgi:hypothetical protein
LVGNQSAEEGECGIATINEIIIASLDFGYPVKPGAYTGEEKTYFTFNYTSEGSDFANDAPNHERNLVQVHFYCPLDFDCVSIRKQVKQKLFAAGFTYPVVTDASDKVSQHLTFECEIAEGADGEP